jgi:deoxyribodipyrimidine photo-lyase
MQECIIGLKKQLEARKGNLYFFKGKPWDIVNDLLSNSELDLHSIFFNRDYTPYSKKRDKLIQKVAKSHDVPCRVFSDLLLNEPESVLKNDRTPYTVFTPFYRKASENKIPHPNYINLDNFFNRQNFGSINLEDMESSDNPYIFIRGGRKNGSLILQNLRQYRNYETERDIPSKQGTTLLSSHLRFGTLSIREVFHAIKNQENFPLLRQLYWRDFYHYIGFYFPYVFKKSFREKYNNLKWVYNEKVFKKWTEGKTGFPIVDAGMRQLNKTGFMHNRIRMIVASFLTKDLHINWQQGEKYFAQKLVDFDISVNNGNWQWSSSTGCDPVPYFRIFNPWTQQKKYDPDCKYIKKYISELRDLTPKEIHNLEKSTPRGLIYPRPIVNHSEARKKALRMFKTIQEI